MGRISRQVMFMDMARAAQRRSTCFRLNVGALVVANNNPVSVGWNGQAPGAPHCTGNDCPGIVPGRCGTFHAEVNALEKASALLSGQNLHTVDLYCTHSPCFDCTEYIRTKTGLTVKRLFFEIPYRNTQHLSMLQHDDPEDTCIQATEVYEVTPAGYITEYFTRRVVELP